MIILNFYRNIDIGYINSFRIIGDIFDLLNFLLWIIVQRKIEIICRFLVLLDIVVFIKNNEFKVYYKNR